IENVRHILEAAGSSLDRVLDVTAYLIDMDRDFATFNRVYAEYLGHVEATRTTLAVTALPTPIAIELKVVAASGQARETPRPASPPPARPPPTASPGPPAMRRTAAASACASPTAPTSISRRSKPPCTWARTPTHQAATSQAAPASHRARSTSTMGPVRWSP